MTRPCLSRNVAGGVQQPFPLMLASFEAWLRSRGYQSARDPFVPLAAAGSAGSEEAAGLVDDYLRDRPAERANHAALVAYAREIGDVFPVWGESVGFDVALGDWQKREVAAGVNEAELLPHPQPDANAKRPRVAGHLEPAPSRAPVWYASEPPCDRPQP